MFKKLKLSTLAVIFIVLLVIVIISQVVNNKRGDSNFKKQIFDIDTVKVTSIIIKTKTEKELELIKDGKNWSVKEGQKAYRADMGMVKAMLAEAYNIKAERLAATEEAEWNKYLVTDTTGTHVKFKQGSKVVANFLVGKFSYSQNPQKFNTYIRLSDEKEVYAVDGFLSMTFNKRFDDLRNKELVNVPSTQVTRLTFSYPADSSFTLVKDKKGWKINGREADSSKVAGYVNSISNISGNEFIKDNENEGIQIFRLKIEGNNFNPVEINAFVADTIKKYIITSSINNEGRFSGLSGDITNRIFVGKNRFLPGEVSKDNGINPVRKSIRKH